MIENRQIQEGLSTARDVGKRSTSLILAISEDGCVERERLDRKSPGVSGSGLLGLDLGRGEGVMLLRGLLCRALGMKTLRNDPDG